MMEENNITMNMNSNNCIITNKSCIEKKTISTEEEQDKKDLQFLYQITNQNFSSPQFKKDLTAFLENGKMINLNFISNIGEQFNKNNTPSYLLYKSKVVSFNNNLNSFRNKLNFIREYNTKFNEVTAFIKKLIEEEKYFLDKDFDIKETDSIIDIDKIILHHRYIKNFEGLINIKNKNFKIIEENKNYKLSSDFYEYYTRNYSLIYTLSIKTNMIQIDFSNYLFDSRFERNTRNNKGPIFFYIKYLLYKFFKEEINALRKYSNNTKTTSFDYKGLTLTWEKIPRKLIIKCSYFDNLEINFSISKVNNPYKETNFINSREDSQIIESFKRFCTSIAYNVKYSKVINNFLINVKKCQNMTLDNIIKSSIFIRSIIRLGSSVLKSVLNKVVTEESKNLNIISSEYLTNSPYFAKYQLYFDFIDKGHKMTYLIHLFFDTNLNLLISVKEPYLNHIFIHDATERYSINKGRINFNSLFTILKNNIPLLNTHNFKDVSIKIISL